MRFAAGVFQLLESMLTADSQAGYTLQSGEPVIVEDLQTEERFAGTALLHEHAVVSGP